LGDVETDDAADLRRHHWWLGKRDYSLLPAFKTARASFPSSRSS
jgi:hypothetical protein